MKTPWGGKLAMAGKTGGWWMIVDGRQRHILNNLFFPKTALERFGKAGKGLIKLEAIAPALVAGEIPD